MGPKNRGARHVTRNSPENPRPKVQIPSKNPQSVRTPLAAKSYPPDLRQSDALHMRRFEGGSGNARVQGRGGNWAQTPCRPIAPPPLNPGSWLIGGALHNRQRFSRFKKNARRDWETREQRAEWFTEHDALSSPNPQECLAIGVESIRQSQPPNGRQRKPREQVRDPDAATVPALPGRWLWELCIPVTPKRSENSVRRLGRHHLTHRSLFMMHRITSVSASRTPSEAQTPPPIPVFGVVAVTSPPGRLGLQHGGWRRDSGASEAPLQQNVSDDRRSSSAVPTTRCQEAARMESVRHRRFPNDLNGPE